MSPPPAHLQNRTEKDSVSVGLESQRPAFTEAAALLSLWSLLVINEGALRFNHLALPNGRGYDDFGLGRPTVGLLFFAALFEVLFGFLGLFLGVGALLLRVQHASLSRSVMVIQMLLGAYVFVMYVFVQPVWRAVDKTDVVPVGLDPSVFRALIVMGILTSFHLCLALQGGQFVFLARLVAADAPDELPLQREANRLRGAFWAGNQALAGLWTSLAGLLLLAKVGSGKTTVYMYAPHVGRLPMLTFLTGVFNLLYGAYSMWAVAASVSTSVAYYVMGALVFIGTWLNFTIVQFGVIGQAARGVSMHCGLVFTVGFLGPYFISHISPPSDDGDGRSEQISYA